MEVQGKTIKKLSAKQRAQKKVRRDKKRKDAIEERKKRLYKQCPFLKNRHYNTKISSFHFYSTEESSQVLLPNMPIQFRHKFLTFHYKPNILAIEVRKYNRMWNNMFRAKIIQKGQYPFFSCLETFRSWFYKYTHVRYQLRKLLFAWLKRKCIQNPMNEEDCISQQIIKKPVYVFDISQRRSWVFEACELYKYILYKMSYNEDLFPSPQMPCNLLSNIPYNYGTMISIIDQLRKYNYNHWLLEAYSNCKGNLRLLCARFYVPLQVQGLHLRCKDHKDEFVNDELLNFIEDKLEVHGQTSKYDFIKWMLKQHSNHHYCNVWKNLFKRNYLIELQDMSNQHILQETLYIETKIKELFVFNHELETFYKNFCTSVVLSNV